MNGPGYDAFMQSVAQSVSHLMDAGADMARCEGDFAGLRIRVSVGDWDSAADEDEDDE